MFSYYIARILLFCSTFLLGLQITTLPLFIIYKEYKNMICYRQMFSIGIFEIFLHICGNIYSVSFMLLIFQQTCLAVNRLIVVIKTYRLSNVEYTETKIEKILFNSIIIISWILAFIYVLIATNGNSGLLYDPESLAFNEYKNIKERKLMTRFDLQGVLIMIPLPLTTLTIYCTVFTLLIKMRIQNNKNSVLCVSLLKPEEYRLLIQSIFMFITFNITLITWFLKSWIEESSDYKIFKPLWMLTFTCICGLNPVLYLCMSRKLRNQMLIFIRWNKP
ncbi:hypothetical protein Mgra_00006881 [Meloidogyne graminicola]|uniref:G_PROTEIN_RECEP_F1_2 domain-containing protein n=1 Tax=Meloidogyne graminicola TaxID=189291 RepID=A0A8S9ZKB5_9BILA|nr:hypothetical protein Mgra_00006881 [Meloidogyne graminicola]